METVPIQGDILGKITTALSRSMLFSNLDEKLLLQVAKTSQLVRAKPGEVIVEEGAPADAFFLILQGEVSVQAKHKQKQEMIELARMGSNDSFGELGLLLGENRSATVSSVGNAMMLRFDTRLFSALFDRIPGFGVAVCRALAGKLAESTKQIVSSQYDVRGTPPDADTLALLPMAFIERHRVLPLAKMGNELLIGIVDAPTPKLLNLAQQQVGAMKVKPVRISSADFDFVLSSQSGLSEWHSKSDGQASMAVTGDTMAMGSGADPHMDLLLRRMVAEGASDLHLTGKHRPRWRVDGEMREISDAPVLGEEEVYDLLVTGMMKHHIVEFKDTNDCDFSLALPGLARFRVNLFRDGNGSGAVLRVIPAKILEMKDLGLPQVVQDLCDNPKGMVLVTGPTGSGKSTTLAAMIDHINRTVPGHIITMEDPVEFVHQSRKCLVNQREVKTHTTSFSRALKAALREDPDIVLVGEMRDIETVSLALETANTGHLVFGTLHTTTAIGTVERIIDMFPTDQHSLVRAVLADCLRGVVAQTLCRRKGGGRVGVYEILVVNAAVSNLIREGKGHQILSIMQTGKKLGMTILNEELARLVNEGVIEHEEAMSKTVDKKDLEKRLRGA